MCTCMCIKASAFTEWELPVVKKDCKTLPCLPFIVQLDSKQQACNNDCDNNFLIQY